MTPSILRSHHQNQINRINLSLSLIAWILNFLSHLAIESCRHADCGRQAYSSSTEKKWRQEFDFRQRLIITSSFQSRNRIQMLAHQLIKVGQNNFNWKVRTKVTNYMTCFRRDLPILIRAFPQAERTTECVWVCLYVISQRCIAYPRITNDAAAIAS